VSALLFFSPHSQQTAVPSAQASLLLQKAMNALAPNISLTDVTLSGTARRIAGADDETGSVVMKALATGEARLDLTFASGQRTEVYANSDNGPIGTWSAGSGAAHSVSIQNLMTDSSWFFPALTVAKVSSPKYVVSYVDTETKNGQLLVHLIGWQLPLGKSASPGVAAEIQRLSQLHVFLDPTSYLPVILSFSVHPDNNASIDIPIESRSTAILEPICLRRK